MAALWRSLRSLWNFLRYEQFFLFSYFASTPFQDLSYVTLFRYSLLIMWGFDPFRRPPRRRRRLAMPRRTLRLIDSLLKFKFKHKFILGDRCSPWRHRRGRRLLNLSFILFLLPRIKPHQPGCYQDLIKTNFNKKGDRVNKFHSSNPSVPLAYWLERPSPLTFSLSSAPLSCWDIALALGIKQANQLKRQKTKISV